MSDRPESPSEGEADDEKWPIGFLIIVILTAVYLSYRLIQGVMWLVRHI